MKAIKNLPLPVISFLWEKLQELLKIKFEIIAASALIIVAILIEK